MLRSLFISNISFGIKALCSLGISVILASSLELVDFTLWSILISISMYLSLSDFGLGQYILRSTVSYRNDEISINKLNRILKASNSILIFLILLFQTISIVFFMFYEKFSNINLWTLSVFSLLVLLRTLVIPYLAILSAYEKFHIRKLIEAFSLTCCLIAVYFLIIYGVEMVYILIIYQLILLTCSLLAIYVCRNYGYTNLIFISNSKKYFNHSIKNSKPYFINNLSLLVTRGGLILLISFVANDMELAQVAVLYTIFFQLIYQFFDILIRTVQPVILSNKILYNRTTIFMYVFMIIFVVASYYFGILMLEFIYPNLTFELVTLLSFLLLVFTEIIFTSINAKWQMFEEKNTQVQLSSFVKAITFIFITGIFYWQNIISGIYLLLIFYAVGNLFSLATAFFYNNKLTNFKYE